LSSLLAPLISPYDPRFRSSAPFAVPSSAHWLGTNDIGQDLLAELIWGGRVSLSTGALAALVAIALAVAIGITAGYFRRWTDTLCMRIADVVLVIPFLPLMIVLAAYVGPGVVQLALVVGLLAWARPARVIRATVLGLAARDSVIAVRALGAGHTRILIKHLLPAVLPLAACEFVQLMSRAILIEASLAFLGLGDPLQKSWGTMLYYAQARGALLTGAWLWWVIPPGLLIAATVLGCALLGMHLERLANPRLRPR
jgi:ABC-type dipeptide/oligopeptide/nickel transport system permease subunit